MCFRKLWSTTAAAAQKANESISSIEFNAFHFIHCNVALLRINIIMIIFGASSEILLASYWTQWRRHDHTQIRPDQAVRAVLKLILWCNSLGVKLGIGTFASLKFAFIKIKFEKKPLFSTNADWCSIFYHSIFIDFKLEIIFILVSKEKHFYLESFRMQ